MPAPSRPETLEALRTGTFDLLVIGAGIVGSRIAYEAANAGLRVALVDAGDFGGGTSSASSKLVHGGLRYLSTGQIGLVRASLAERRVLERRVAPHLVTQLPLVVAVPGTVGRTRVSAGAHLYAALAGFRDPRGRILRRQEVLELVPVLREDVQQTCLLLQEATTHDGRLTLATVEAAARTGATVVNYMSVLAFEQVRGRVAGAVLQGHSGEGLVTLRCRAAVNATGPWVDRVRQLEDPLARSTVRLSKGVHVVLPAAEGWRAALALWDEGRSLVVVPWQGVLLLGATDTPFEGDPGDVRPEDADVAELLAAGRHLLPAEALAPGRVLSAFAGLRVLPPGNSRTSRAPRSHVVTVGPAGLVSVAGGKLTIHRRIAADALRCLPPEVRPRSLGASERALTSAVPSERAGLPRDDPGLISHLLGLYGNDVGALAEHVWAPDAFERIHPDGPDVWAQAYRAVEREWALTPEDIARRRTTLAVRGLFDERIRARLARLTERPGVRV
jgi:glycerol-3-phosphate dehydrogenase